MTTQEQYIKDEQSNIEYLQERLEILNKKWFKTSHQKLEMEFLKRYIELKQKFVDSL